MNLQEMLAKFPEEWTLSLTRDDIGQWSVNASNDAVGGPERERVVIQTDCYKRPEDAVQEAIASIKEAKA